MTNRISRSPDRARVAIITGPLHAGKTTLANRLIKRLRSCGYRTAGIVSHGYWKDGIRSRFDVEDLSTGRLAPLAERSCNSGPGGMAFAFDPRGLEAGRSALDPAVCKEASVVVIDEIGRLELAGEGWGPCLEPLLAISQAVHVWIVRDSLVEKVCRFWNIEPELTVSCSAPDAFAILTHGIERILSGMRP